MPNQPWPVLSRYPRSHLARIAMPLGGIGTGSISLGGRGNLHDFEVMNKPAKGYTPLNAFFALWAKPARGPAVARCLEGALTPPFEGPFGDATPQHGLPRFRSCRFLAAYPLAQVELSDPEVPLEATLQAFNPLVPTDARASGLPVAALRFVLRNRGSTPVRAAICGSLENFIGFERDRAATKGNVNAWRVGEHVRGIAMSSTGVDRIAPQWGTLALCTTAPGELSWRTAWTNEGWGGPLLDWWDDFLADGRVEERERAPGLENPTASLCAPVAVPARGEAEVTFLISWHFPNRQTWSPATPAEAAACRTGDPNHVGNWYTGEFADAWEAAERVARELPELERRTVAFVRSFCGSDLPQAVKEAGLNNISTLRTQTCFRTPDGRLFGWEGSGDREGSCNGSCTHVWNYEQTTPFLFGALAKTMREVEYAYATDPESGHMCFRANLPLERARGWKLAAADGQMGCLLKLHREWQLSGDEAWLRSLWPNARRSLEFCWIPGGWDADQDGVMEGCQHNTMDVEYYGPNAQMQFWYLGALRAAEELARHLGEADFADRCRALFTRGSRWADRHLFNGDYYEHEVRPMRLEDIAPGLRHESMGSRELSDPDFQLGSACLIDQLVGQMLAHICGLGHLADPKKIAKALASVKRFNSRNGMWGHFNHLRSFALSDESAVLMASYPRGRRPRRPFPYANEVMTGFEHTAAIGMIYEGMERDALEVVEAVRARYDGARRSPFNEAECGHHYARAMAAWGELIALTGFRWSAVERTVTFRAPKQPVRWFWANGWAFGTVSLKPARGGMRVRLDVGEGEVVLETLRLDGFGEVVLSGPRRLRAGETLELEVPRAQARRRASALAR
jgi:uncharacterized protein (DUF608 family)